MTKLLSTVVAGMALAILAVSGVWAQGGWQNGGSQGRWAATDPAARQQVTALHAQIRQVQTELSRLRLSNGDPALIQQKEQELAQLRTQLRTLMQSLTPTTPVGKGPKAGAATGQSTDASAATQARLRAQKRLQDGSCLGVQKQAGTAARKATQTRTRRGGSR